MSRNFSNVVAADIVTSSTLNDSTTTITIDDGTTLPSADFAGRIDSEVVLVTGVAGASSTSLTVTRGFDGTTAATHASGAGFQHVVIARDLRFSGVSLTKDTDQTTATGVAEAVEWEVENYDTDDYHEGVTNPSRITIPEDGYYHFTATTVWDADVVDDCFHMMHLRVDGSSTNHYGEVVSFKSGTTSLHMALATSWTGYLTASQYVEVWARQDSGSDADIDGTKAVNAYNQFSCFRVG